MACDAARTRPARTVFVTTCKPPGAVAATRRSFSEAIRAEADVAQLAALRALADVLGELLRVQRLHRAVLALDAGDDERLAVAERDRRQLFLLRDRDQLHADPAVRPHRHFVEREEEQP